MLLMLADWLSQYNSGFRVFQYLTMRSILATLTALFIAFLVGPTMIRRLTFHKIGQAVRQDGPDTHFKKAGTPTMGGTLILVAVGLSTLLWADLNNRYVWVVLFVTLLTGVIGFIDDYKKVALQDPKGLSAGKKYLGQSVIALAAALFLFYTATSPQETTLYLPFLKDVNVQLGWLFVPLTYFVIVGTSNAVNLTDGLDGLAIMPTVLVAGALGIFAYLSGNVQFAQYLGIPSLKGTGELVVFAAPLLALGWGFYGLTPTQPWYLWGTWALWHWVQH